MRVVAIMVRMWRGAASMFQDRLNSIMETLKLTPSLLARYSEIDRTVISKFRSGARTPSLSSGTLRKVVSGIMKVTEETEQRCLLYDLIGYTADEDETRLQEKLYAFLIENEETSPNDKAMTQRRRIGQEKAFGERLDACMNLVKMSNVRLSKILNVDASLISRYRTGSRTPRSNPQIMRKMGAVLFERAVAVGKYNALSQLIGDENAKIDEMVFTKWLFQTSKEENSIITEAKRILYSLNSFKVVPIKTNVLVQDGVNSSMLNEEKTVYRGIKELRRACIRLLSHAIISNAHELWLYCDFDMAWMTTDRTFFLTWSALMAECVQKKIHIHIVHCLKRRMDEMLAAIEGWLPLYMSGMVDSYYCTANTHIAFSHILFVCPKVAAIEACNVSGTEVNGRYRYHTVQEEIAFYEISFNKFLANACPLVKVYEHEPEIMKKAVFIIRADSITVCLEGTEKKTIPLRDYDFKNVTISIGDDFIGVTRLQDKNVTFFMTHAYMVEAFIVYAQSLLEEMQKNEE